MDANQNRVTNFSTLKTAKNLLYPPSSSSQSTQSRSFQFDNQDYSNYLNQSNQNQYPNQVSQPSQSNFSNLMKSQKQFVPQRKAPSPNSQNFVSLKKTKKTIKTPEAAQSDFSKISGEETKISNELKELEVKKVSKLDRINHVKSVLNPNVEVMNEYFHKGPKGFVERFTNEQINNFGTISGALQPTGSKDIRDAFYLFCINLGVFAPDYKQLKPAILRLKSYNNVMANRKINEINQLLANEKAKLFCYKKSQFEFLFETYLKHYANSNKIYYTTIHERSVNFKFYYQFIDLDYLLLNQLRIDILLTILLDATVSSEEGIRKVDVQIPNNFKLIPEPKNITPKQGLTNTEIINYVTDSLNFEENINKLYNHYFVYGRIGRLGSLFSRKSIKLNEIGTNDYNGTKILIEFIFGFFPSIEKNNRGLAKISDNLNAIKRAFKFKIGGKRSTLAATNRKLNLNISDHSDLIKINIDPSFLQEKNLVSEVNAGEELQSSTKLATNNSINRTAPTKSVYSNRDRRVNKEELNQNRNSNFSEGNTTNYLNHNREQVDLNKLNNESNFSALMEKYNNQKQEENENEINYNEEDIEENEEETSEGIDLIGKETLNTIIPDNLNNIEINKDHIKITTEQGIFYGRLEHITKENNELIQQFLEENKTIDEEENE